MTLFKHAGRSWICPLAFRVSDTYLRRGHSICALSKRVSTAAHLGKPVLSIFAFTVQTMRSASSLRGSGIDASVEQRKVQLHFLQCAPKAIENERKSRLLLRSIGGNLDRSVAKMSEKLDYD
jgi:hypothetical protein